MIDRKYETFGSRPVFYDESLFKIDIEKKAARLITLLEMRDHLQAQIDEEFGESPILDEQLLVKEALENVTNADLQEMRLHPDYDLIESGPQPGGGNGPII